MVEEKITDEQIEQLQREQDIESRRMADKEQLWRAKMIEERQKTRKREGRDPKTGKLIDTQGVDVLRLSKLAKIEEVVDDDDEESEEFMKELEELTEEAKKGKSPEGIVPSNNLEKATIHKDESNPDKFTIRYWIEEYNKLNAKYKLVRDTLLNFCRPQIQGIKETYALFLLLQGLDKEKQGDI